MKSKKLDLSFNILYQDLLYLINKLLNNQKVYILGWSMGAIFTYYCIVQTKNPENIFLGAIIFSGRDYWNKYYPTVGKETLVKSRFQPLNFFANQVLQVLFPRNYLEYLGKEGYKLFKNNFIRNYSPLSKQVIQAENNASNEITNGKTKIRSKWKYISKNSHFKIIIFHATEDAIVSVQYQDDMKTVLPKQWNVKFITYNGIDTVNGGHAFLMQEDIKIGNINIIKGLTSNVTQNIINFFY